MHSQTTFYCAVFLIGTYFEPKYIGLLFDCANLGYEACLEHNKQEINKILKVGKSDSYDSFTQASTTAMPNVTETQTPSNTSSKMLVTSSATVAVFAFVLVLMMILLIGLVYYWKRKPKPNQEVLGKFNVMLQETMSLIR